MDVDDKHSGEILADVDLAPWSMTGHWGWFVAAAGRQWDMVGISWEYTCFHAMIWVWLKSWKKTPQYDSIHRAGRYMVYVYIYLCLHQKAPKCNWVNALTPKRKQIDINSINHHYPLLKSLQVPLFYGQIPLFHLHRFDGRPKTLQQWRKLLCPAMVNLNILTTCSNLEGIH